MKLECYLVGASIPPGLDQGDTALDRELSRDEKRTALFLDYLDALLQTYRQRVRYMECRRSTFRLVSED